MSIVLQTRYVRDYIAAYETQKATLVPTVRNDTQDMGGSMVFMVSGTGGRTAVTRGSRGIIPPSDNVESQVTLTFKEAHDKLIRTNFDIFRAQGDEIKMMREQSLYVIHRQQDIEIMAALDTATTSVSASPVTGSLALAQAISTKLYQAHVGINAPGMITAVITPAVFNELLGIVQFSSADYTAKKQVDDGAPLMTDSRYWMGIQWMVHPDLPGAGTSSSTNYVYHHDAVGYATSTRGIDAYLGYNQEDDYTIRRASIFHAAVKLQDAGILKFTHDDTAITTLP